jgi:hypothetical protein
MIRTHARFWAETPEGELVFEFSTARLWYEAYQQAVHERERLIFRSDEAFDTGASS